MSAQEKMKELRDKLSDWMGEPLDDGWWEYIVDRCRVANDGYRAVELVQVKSKKANFALVCILQDICLLLPYYDNPVLETIEHVRKTIEDILSWNDPTYIIPLNDIRDGFEEVVRTLNEVKGK